MRNLFTIDTKDYDPNGTVEIRPSVRALIIRGDGILMVHSLKYDYYKFPGGGIEAGETMHEALCREVAEETGLAVAPDSIREYGMVHRISKGLDTDVFIQDNYYFLCDAGASVDRNLDDYEEEEGFTPEFVTAQHAIHVNRFHDHCGKWGIVQERDSRILELLLEEDYFK